MNDTWDSDRRLATAVAAAIETERHLLARELHDGPVQSLWSLGVEIQQLEALVSRQLPTWQPRLQALRALWAQVYDELRQTIGQLHDPLPPGEALVPSLQRSLARLERDCGLTTSLQVDSRWSAHLLDPAREAQLVRIGQGALANVRRHAAARHVTVSVRLAGRQVVLAIADDGVGFDPAQQATAESEQLGLASIRARAELLGGRVELASAPGRGTQLEVWVPLDTGAVAD